MAQRQNFERGAHFRHFLHFGEVEAGDTHAAARLAHRKPLRLEAAERLAHRNVAGAEFLGDMVLSQPRAGLDLACDDAVGQRPGDSDRQRVFFLCAHIS